MFKILSSFYFDNRIDYIWYYSFEKMAAATAFGDSYGFEKSCIYPN